MGLMFLVTIRSSEFGKQMGPRAQVLQDFHRPARHVPKVLWSIREYLHGPWPSPQSRGPASLG